MPAQHSNRGQEQVFEHLGVRRLRSGEVMREARAQKRVARDQVWPVQVAQPVTHGIGEVGLGQHQRLVDRLGVPGDVLREGALDPELHERIDRHPAEVVAVQPVAPSADHEVRAGRPLQVGEREVLVPRLRLMEREEVPGEPRGLQVTQQRRDRGGVQRGRRSLIALTVDDEPRLGDHLARPRRRTAVRVLPRRERAGIGTAILLVGRREVQQSQEAADLVVGVAHDEEGRRLPVEPALGDHGRFLALGRAHQLQDARAIAVAGRLGIVMAPRVPVDWRQDAREVAEEELEIERRALLCSPPRRPHAGVHVTADATEQALVALGVAPAQVGVERVAGEVVREHAVRARLDEGQIAQPREHVVRVVEGDGVPDQRFGGHARESACLEGTTALIGRDQIDEPSQQRGDEVGRQRVDLGLPATRGDVGEQGQPERVTVTHLGEPLVRGGVDAARAQVAPALLRTQVAERHHSEKAAPRGVAPPACGRQVAARDDRESVSGSAGSSVVRIQPSRTPSRS